MGNTRPQREMGYRFGTAGLVEADQVKSKVLDPVERPAQIVRFWMPLGLGLNLVTNRSASTWP